MGLCCPDLLSCNFNTPEWEKGVSFFCSLFLLVLLSAELPWPRLFPDCFVAKLNRKVV